MNDEPMNKIKSRLLIAVLIILATHSYAEMSPAMKIAKDKSIEGKFIYGKCAVFAMQLHYRFDIAQIPAYVIFEKLSVPGATSYHAIVVFKDGDIYYGTDNMCRKPMALFGPGPREWALSFEDACGRKSAVEIVDMIPPVYKLREEVK